MFVDDRFPNGEGLRPGTQGRGATGERHRYAAVDVLRHWDQLRGFRSGGRCPRSEHCDRPGRRSGCRLFSGPGLALRFLELAVLLDELGYQRVDDVLGFSWGCAGPAVRRSVPRPVPPVGVDLHQPWVAVDPGSAAGVGENADSET